MVVEPHAEWPGRLDDQHRPDRRHGEETSSGVRVDAIEHACTPRHEPAPAAGRPGDERERQVGGDHVERENRHIGDALAGRLRRRMQRPGQGRAALSRDIDDMRRDQRAGDRQQPDTGRRSNNRARYSRREETAASAE